MLVKLQFFFETECAGAELDGVETFHAGPEPDMLHRSQRGKGNRLVTTICYLGSLRF